MSMDTRVLQVTNVAPSASKEQMKTLFGYIGKLDEVKLYPENELAVVASKVCYIKFRDYTDAGVGLHLTNTVFVDRALIVVPVPDGKILDETHAMQIAAPANAVAGVMPPSSSWPSNVVNQVTGVGLSQVITTIDPRLTALGLPQYPSLPGNVDPTKIEEIRRTVYVGNLDSTQVTAEQLLNFFNQVGEIKYVRMAGDETQPTRFAFVEFSDQRSVATALTYSGVMFSGRPLKVNHSTNAIIKPQSKSQEAAAREIEEAMKKVKEAQSLITAAIDPDTIIKKDRSRSRSKSRRHRSRSRSRKRSGSRSRRKSRSRSRKRSGSRSRSKRSRSRKRSTSRSRRKSRSPKRRRSRSKSKDRRKRRRSPTPPRGYRGRRSRSRSRKGPPPIRFSRDRRRRSTSRTRSRRSLSKEKKKTRTPSRSKSKSLSPPKLQKEASPSPIKNKSPSRSPEKARSESPVERKSSESPTKVVRKSESPSKVVKVVKKRSRSRTPKKRSRSRTPKKRSRSRTPKKISCSRTPKKRSRSRTPIKRRSRTPKRRSRSPRRRSPKRRSPKRRSRSPRRRSPVRRRSGSRSRRRSRSRSVSPRRHKKDKKRDRDRSHERSKKKRDKDLDHDEKATSEIKIKRDYDEEEKGFSSDTEGKVQKKDTSKQDTSITEEGDNLQQMDMDMDSD